jgi:hypothetical protein
LSSFPARLLNLRPKRFNFSFKILVLFHLALEEATGQCQPLSNALRGEQVHVLELVLALVKISHLHKALVYQGVEAVVQATHTHAELVSQLSQGEVRIFLQDAHDPEMGVFLDLGLAAGHVSAAILRPTDCHPPDKQLRQKMQMPRLRL